MKKQLISATILTGLVTISIGGAGDLANAEPNNTKIDNYTSHINNNKQITDGTGLMYNTTKGDNTTISKGKYYTGGNIQELKNVKVSDKVKLFIGTDDNGKNINDISISPDVSTVFDNINTEKGTRAVDGLTYKLRYLEKDIVNKQDFVSVLRDANNKLIDNINSNPDSSLGTLGNWKKKVDLKKSEENDDYNTVLTNLNNTIKSVKDDNITKNNHEKKSDLKDDLNSNNNDQSNSETLEKENKNNNNVDNNTIVRKLYEYESSVFSKILKKNKMSTDNISLIQSNVVIDNKKSDESYNILLFSSN